jgi:hypothetical protein
MKLKDMMNSFALMAPDDGEGGAPAAEATPPSDPPSDPPAATPAPPVAPGEQQVTMTQNQLDALIKKEKGKAARSATKQAASQQQPTQQPIATSENDGELAALKTQVQELTSMLGKVVETSAAEKQDAAFMAEFAGIKMSEEDADMARTLFDADPEKGRKFKAKLTAGDNPPAPTGEFNGIGAPAPAKPAAGLDAMSWTGDDVKSMQEAGTFLNNLKTYRRSLSGGSSLFPTKKTGG